MRTALGSIVVGGLIGALLWTGPVGAQQPQSGLPACQASLKTCQTNLGKCQMALAECQTFPGDGVDGQPLSYTDNRDGTFTDNNTLLMWEKKVPGSGCLHCVGDAYRFPGQTPPEETASAFLAAINTEGGVGLGGHNDWRIPNPKELQSLVDYSRKIPASSVPGSSVVSDNERFCTPLLVSSQVVENLRRAEGAEAGAVSGWGAVPALRPTFP